MKKQEFLLELREGLCGLAQEDLEERLAFYSEQIDDRIEDGLSEAEAVASVGRVSDIVLQVVDEYPLQEIIKTRIRTRKPMSTPAIVLLVLGSPIWFSLLMAAFSVMFVLYVSLWSVIVSLWAVFVALAGSALGCVAGGILFACTGYMLPGLAVIAGGLVCGGLSVFAFYGCKAASKGAAWLTKAMAFAIKKACLRKEAAQ